MSCAVNKGLVGGRCVHAAESDLRSPLVFIKWFFMNLSFFFLHKSFYTTFESGLLYMWSRINEEN